MSASSGWSHASQLPAAEIASMVNHLEDRAGRSDQQQVNQALRSILSPQTGERILEVGCGSGVLCRLMAGFTYPGGKVIGLDSAFGFLQHARQRAAGGWAEEIALLTGRAETLPCRSAAFDAAFAARLLLHVSKPQVVLGEMLRVVRPGGRVVLMDWDFGTAAVDHPDRELTRRILNWRCDHHSGNGWSGRQLHRQAVQAGLHQVQAFAVPAIAHDEEQALTLSLWRAAEVARDGGVITPEEHDSWVWALKEDIASGCFFASIDYFIITGRK